MAPRPTTAVSRRAALAGLAAGGLGLAVSARGGTAAAQEATPYPTAGHPLVGTWVFDRDVDDATDAPRVVVFTADGGLLDPGEGVAGAWRATGPRSAAWTLVAFLPEGPAGYVAVRSTGEVDAGGAALAGPHSFTVVLADGTVAASGRARSTATRLPIEPIEAEGTPLGGFPTWTPATPETATPTP